MQIRTQTTPPRRALWCTGASPAGKLVLALSENGELCRVSFLRGRKAFEVAAEWQVEWDRTHFSPGAAVKDAMALPLLLVGTPFQTDVWKEVRRIRRGEVASYGEVAQRINHPRAARAVGTACGGNLLAYVVPCHRVVSACGIGGYGPAGLAVKRALLKKEGVILAEKRPA